MDDTIFAVASGSAPAAIAIVRISGPAAAECVRAIAGSCPPPRRATLRTLRDPASADMLDRAMVLWFPGPRSATGEDVAEFHVHGGTAVQDAVLAALARVAGCRLALPGEFTRRAHARGRIDLLQAEGLADLLSAETEAQRRAALSLSEGALSREMAAWQDRLLALSAELEMAIDYADDDQADGVTLPDLAGRIAVLAEEWRRRLAQPPSEAVRDGFRVVLAGPPNAGKSSLFNRLVGEDAAIVTDIAGTTRDRLDARVIRQGRIFRLVDTAGLRTDTEDAIERIGIGRARDAIAQAELVLWLGDGPAADMPNAIRLWARCDEATRRDTPAAALAVSAVSGVGVDRLWAAIEARSQAGWEGTAGLRRRHMAELAAALDALDPLPADPVVLAEGLRSARAALGRIVGGGGVEDLLDGIFGRFCLGK